MRLAQVKKLTCAAAVLATAACASTITPPSTGPALVPVADNGYERYPPPYVYEPGYQDYRPSRGSWWGRWITPSQRVHEPFPNPAPAGLLPVSDSGAEARAAAYDTCPARVLRGYSLPGYMHLEAHRDRLVNEGIFVTDAETYAETGLIYARCIERESGSTIYLANCGTSPTRCNFARSTRHGRAHHHAHGSSAAIDGGPY